MLTPLITYALAPEFVTAIQKGIRLTSYWLGTARANAAQEAKKQLILEFENSKQPDKFLRKQMKEILTAIVENTENADAKSKIENRAKKLVLIDFFNKKKELNFEKII